ncbi:MAG: glycosyltransferase family 2 protein, partial [Actinocatenispora sp.]
MSAPNPLPRPGVGVVIATHQRPALLRLALDAVLSQDYDGALRVVIVYDGAEPDMGLAADGPRPVTVLTNTRTRGLAGARNTGIDALCAGDRPVDLVAFCDDDDQWLPGKLTAQVAALAAHPGAEFVTAAIEVEYADRVHPRRAGTDVVVFDDLLRSRMSMLHASTFLIRRTALLGAGKDTGIGLVAEDAPGSQNEDYDLLLRAARRRPISHVDVPLVRVLWGRSSFFTYQYQTKIASLQWMLTRHPELADCRPGAARLYGQLACWHAADGQRRTAVHWARRSLRCRWRE